jgi:prepilin-type N-terminal cleavage/methylation domain-containing protein
MDRRGVTLIELMVVISVIVVVALVAGFSYKGWQGRYRVESEVRVMYSDMMRARAKAMNLTRTHCVTFVADSGGGRGQYSVIEDRDPAPDGDGDCCDAGDLAPDWFAQPKTVNYPFPAGVVAGFRFDGNGLANTTTPILFVTDVDVEADYDCINISSTRINMGKWDGTDCAER